METEHAPFTIVIDTREQRPILFEHVYVNHIGATTKKLKGRTRVIVPTARQSLKTGDYSILGMEEAIAIERKSIPDLQRSITHQRGRTTGRHNRERLEAEFGRMQEMKFSAVFVEGSWEDFMRYCHLETKMSPTAANTTIIDYQIRFPRTHWVWTPRDLMSKRMYQYFFRFYKGELYDRQLG